MTFLGLTEGSKALQYVGFRGYDDDGGKSGEGSVS